MTTATILGVTDTLTDATYAEGFKHTGKVFEEAITIFDEVRSSTRSDWKLKLEHKDDKCFNKRFPMGKVYTLRKEYPVNVEAIFADHWNDIESTQDWSPNTDYVKRVAVIGSQADILQYALSDVSVIKGKEFVVCRMFRKTADGYVVCASSFDSNLPVVPKKSRATAVVVGGKMTALSANTTVVDYILSVELHDKLIPENILSTNVAEMLVKDATAAYNHLTAKFGGAH